MLIIEELIKSWELSLPLIQRDRLELITLFEHIAGISLLMQGEFSILKQRNSFQFRLDKDSLYLQRGLDS